MMMKLTRKSNCEDRWRQHGVTLFTLGVGLLLGWLMTLGFFGEHMKAFTITCLLFLSALVVVRTTLVELGMRRRRE